MLYSRVNNPEDTERPPLVLIHGLFGSLDNLGGIARILSETYTVYSVDLPNHGRSPHAQNCGLGDMAEALKAWMEMQGLASACLVGHSLGGKVAMELSLSTPEMVDQLVVLDIAPVTYKPRHHDIFAGLLAIHPEALNKRSEADAILSEYVQEAAVRTFLLKNLVKEQGVFKWRMNLSDLYASYSRLIQSNSQGVYNGPTLFVKAGDSDYIKEKYKKDIIQRFPHVQLKIVPHVGHWLHAEKPDIVAKTILRVLGEEAYG